MPTVTRFEDLEIWQLARIQTNDFNAISNEGPLTRDFELRNQMNASSGSVMDCIAEGFERSGNAEFKNFLVIAKGSNGEFRSQLYRCLDRKYIIQLNFDELYQKNVVLGNKIMAFINYLQTSTFKGQARRTKGFLPNVEHQTSNIEHRDRTSF
jgi:four helix bundle protein